MKHPEFLKKIDWKLLREQKDVLNRAVNIHRRMRKYTFERERWMQYEDHKEKEEAFEGILHLIDTIQDYAVDSMGMSEEEIFNLTEE